MDDITLSQCWETNHAGWWTIDGVMRGERPDARHGYAWTCDTQGGGASLHLLRLKSKTAATELAKLIDKAAQNGGAIWAHATEHSTPDNLIEVMRGLGFQHCKRFETLACDLSGLPDMKPLAKTETRAVTDFAIFDADTAYPGIGPITTKGRKALLEQTMARSNFRPGDVIRMMTYVDGVPASTATVFLHGGIAGLYDVATEEAYSGRGLARQTVLSALLGARLLGVTHAATIASAEAEDLYAGLGFRPVGWTSMLYYSKTKLERHALKMSA